MELFAWLLYAIFYIGPYLIVAILVVLFISVICRVSFALSERIGILIITLIIIVGGIAGYLYMRQGPMDFNSACSSGVGVLRYKNVKAEPYLLNFTKNSGDGLSNSSDATVLDAIFYVAEGYVKYVEIQDLKDSSRSYWLLDKLAQFRKPNVGLGYFKIYVDSIGSSKCRWLMPEDVGRLPYPIYLTSKQEHKLSSKLDELDTNKHCVAVDYVPSPSANYAVEFLLNQHISKKIIKHEIQFVDLKNNNELVGESIAYEYKSSGVWDSVAFWVGNGKRHSRCPINLLLGRPIYEILNFDNSTNLRKAQKQNFTSKD